VKYLTLSGSTSLTIKLIEGLLHPEGREPCYMIRLESYLIPEVANLFHLGGGKWEVGSGGRVK